MSRRLIGLNQGFKVNWRISFHLQRSWGFFQIVLDIEGGSFIGRSIEDSSEEIEGVHG